MNVTDSPARALAAALAGVVLGACTTTTWSSWSTGGTTTASSGSARSSAPDPQMVKLFSILTWKHASRRDDHTGWELIDQAGIDGMSIHYHGSPDPEWLPSWPGGIENYQLADAFLQAAVNRTWQAQCYADYADYRHRWSELARTFRPRLEGLRAPGNYYERALGLLRLENEVAAAARAAQIELPTAHPTHWVGIVHDIRAAIVDLYAEAGRSYVLWRWLPEERTAYGRPWSTDDGVERDQFCSYSEELGTHRTPSMSGAGADYGDLVKQPDWHAPARSAKVKRLLDATATAAKAARARDPAEVPTLDGDSAKGALVQVSRPPLTSARRKGTQYVLTFTASNTTTHWVACRSTGEIERIAGDGRVIHHEVCKPDYEDYNTTITAILDDVPAAITLQKGDYVLVYGTVARNTVRTQGSTTRHDVQLIRAHLGSVDRGGGKTVLSLMDRPRIDP